MEASPYLVERDQVGMHRHSKAYSETETRYNDVKAEQRRYRVTWRWMIISACGVKFEARF